MGVAMTLDAFHKAHENFKGGGTCLEFGVFRGRTFFAQVDEIVNRYKNSSLIGFDSWQGLPEEAENIWIPDRHSVGNFSCDKSVVVDELKRRNLYTDKRFRLIDGFYSTSLTKELQSTITDLIFVNIDVDLYISCKEVLEFIQPLLRAGVIIYFDDWKDPQDKYIGKWGEHLAWEEFIIKYPKIEYEIVAINEVNQRYIEIA